MAEQLLACVPTRRDVIVAGINPRTFIGQGPQSGRPAAYVWLAQPSVMVERDQIVAADQVMARIAAGGTSPPLIVLAGAGKTDPLCQQDAPGWAYLIERAVLTGRQVRVETPGRELPDPAALAMIDMVVVTVDDPAGLNPAYLGLLDRIHLVVRCRNAVDVVQRTAEAKRLGVACSRLWVIPEGANVTTLTKVWPEIVLAAAACGVNASHRLHALTRRGRR